MKSLEIVNEVLEEDDYGILGKEELEQIKQDLENYQELKEIIKKHMRLNDNFCGLHEERKYTFVCKHILSKKETKFLKNLLKELEENEE